MSKPIVVIGAGIGGLSAAIRLAAAGERVVVFEQNDAPGGKMHEVRAGGFRWDTGPSVITMRHVFADLFAAAGCRLEDYLTFRQVEPVTRYFWPDGALLDATRDWPRMAEQIAAIDERDVEGYARYLAYAARVHRTTGPVFIYGPRPSLATVREMAPLDALRLEPWLGMDASIRRHLHSPHLRQFFGRFATYVGASPYLAPATLGVISHVEMTQGVWYPEGGVFGIAVALEKLARELGVEVQLKTGVSQVEVKGGRARGVILAGGQGVDAAAVLANVDVATLYSRLLPQGAAPAAYVRRLRNAPMSCSAYLLLLGVNGRHPNLAHHNIFFCRDYPKEFRDIFERGVPPGEPTIYLSITSKTDSDDAPPGCENWYVLVNAPALGPEFDWKSGESALRDRVLTQLAEFGFDVRDRVVTERSLTPVDLETKTGGWRGALYGELFNSPWVAFRRPASRAVGIKGLYLAGGTTHPGGGVPMVMLSGKLAAEAVLEELA
jgi:phytoene desaturase